MPVAERLLSQLGYACPVIMAGWEGEEGFPCQRDLHVPQDFGEVDKAFFFSFGDLGVVEEA